MMEIIHTSLDSFMKYLQEEVFLNENERYEEVEFKRVGVKSLFKLNQ